MPNLETLGNGDPKDNFIMGGLNGGILDGGDDRLEEDVTDTLVADHFICGPGMDGITAFDTTDGDTNAANCENR